MPRTLILPIALACTLPGIPALAGETEAPARTKVLVLPYQAVFRSVSQAKLDSATELLHRELSTKDELEVIRGASGSPGDAPRPTLEKARALVAEAEAKEAERRFASAIDAWTKARAEFEAAPGAIDKVEEYLEVLHRLALAQVTYGQDDDAAKVMLEAAKMAPSYPLDETRYSRLYRLRQRGVAQAAVRERPGEIAVSSALPGTRISLDGRDMDVAPVVLQKVVAGRHLLRGVLGDVTPYGAFITVEPGKKLEVTASFGTTFGGSGVGKVSDAVAQNAIPTPAVEAAAAAGKEAGASFVLFGALAKDDDRLQVHSYVVEVGSGQIAELEVVGFDLELLTAESDVLRIVQAAQASFQKFPGTARSVAKIEPKIRTQSTVNRVNAAPVLVAEGAPAPAVEDRRDKSRRVFVPLSGGSIVIKDEEE